MKPTPVFHARVSEDGTRLEFVPAERVRRQAHLKRHAGELVDVIVRKARTQRSIRQNAYIHLAATILAEEFGNDLDEMKLILMGEKWGWRLSETFGREMPIKPHTSSMSVQEATEFIDWLPRWAMTEHNINLPLPNEATL